MVLLLMCSIITVARFCSPCVERSKAAASGNPLRWGLSAGGAMSQSLSITSAKAVWGDAGGRAAPLALEDSSVVGP